VRVPIACLFFAVATLGAAPPAGVRRGGGASEVAPGCSVQLVSWNIERGERLPAVEAALDRMAPALALLQEVDVNAHRSGRADVAEVLARRLKLNYLFAAEFEELGQGSSARPAFHGQAVLANWPVAEARVIYFKQQSTHWQPRWFMPDWAVFQRRLGGRLALVVNFGRMVVYNVHLESRASEEMRRSQIEEVIADARRYPATTPIIVAGDMNTRVANPPVAAALVAAGFRQALGGEITTTHKTALDWIFIRGGVSHSDGRIHRDVRASDHFPLSLRLDFSPCR